MLKIVLLLWVLVAIVWDKAPHVVQIFQVWWNDANFYVIAFFVLITLVILSKLISNLQYVKMFTPSEYAKKYPQNKTQSGYSCNQCGSHSIRNWGVDGATDTNRVFICNHCGTHLYRN